MRALILLMVLASAPLVVTCTPREGQPVAQRPAPRAWVVVTYEAKRSDPAMLVLLDTERGEELWRVLGPVLATAPLQWSRVELRRGLRDEDPQVLVP